MATGNNPNDFSETLMKQLHEEQRDGKFCDLLVEVDGEEFPCHRNVLAISCSYFARLLNSDFEDSQAPKVILGGIEASAFNVVLEYFYSGLASVDINNAYNVLQTCNFLGACKLEDICKQFIVKNVSVENLIAIYHFSYHPLNDVRFRSTVMQHVTARFEELILLDDFYEITFEMFEAVLNKKKVMSALSTMIFWWTKDTQRCERCTFDLINCRSYNCNEQVKNQKHNEIIVPVIIKWIRKDIGIRMKYFKELLQTLNLLDGFSAWEAAINCWISNTDCPNEVEILSSVSDLCHMEVLIQGATDMNSIRWHKREGWIRETKYAVNFDTLKHVTVKNEIFHLTYESSTENRFVTGQTILQPPPIVVHDFLLTASNTGSVYLYNSGECLSRIYGVLSYVDFSKEISVNNVYTYNTDYNKWFAVPQIPCYVYNAYFVSLNNSIYVVGGNTKWWDMGGDSIKNIIQRYDPRTYKWSCAKADSQQFSLIGAACVYENKIYVYEKTSLSGGKTKSLRVFDTVADKWQTQIVENDQSTITALVPYKSELWSFPFYSCHVGSIYNVKSRGWSNMMSFNKLAPNSVVMDAVVLP